jgi:hypothetical protein
LFSVNIQHKKAKTKCSPPIDFTKEDEEEFISNDEKVLRNDFDIMEKNIKKGCHDVSTGVVYMVKSMYLDPNFPQNHTIKSYHKEIKKKRYLLSCETKFKLGSHVK